MNIEKFSCLVKECYLWDYKKVVRLLRVFIRFYFRLGWLPSGYVDCWQQNDSVGFGIELHFAFISCNSPSSPDSLLVNLHEEIWQMLHPEPLQLSKHLEKDYQPPSSLFLALCSNRDSFLKKAVNIPTWQMRCSSLSKTEQLYQSEKATSGADNVSFRINSDIIQKEKERERDGGREWWLNSDREQGGWLPITEAIRWVHFETTALVNMRHGGEDKCPLWSHTLQLSVRQEELACRMQS